MPARVSTDVPADSLRAFMGMSWERDLMRRDHPAALGITALRNIARYAPAGKRVRLWIEWETEADRHQDTTGPTEAPFGYQSEEVAEAFNEWCSAEGVEARNDQEYRWLRQAFTAGMNETARYMPADSFGLEAHENHAPGPAERCAAGSGSQRCILTAGHAGVHDPGPDGDGHAPDCGCRFCSDEPESEPEPDPADYAAEYDPGPEVDDQGGMSEYRHHEPEPWQ